MKFHGEKRSIIARVRSWPGFLEDGAAIVEMALVSSLLLTMVTGVSIFGIFEMQVMALTEGVNSGGRVLAVSAGQTLDPCAAAASAIQGAAPLLKASNLTYNIQLNPTPSSGSSTNHAIPSRVARARAPQLGHRVIWFQVGLFQ